MSVADGGGDDKLVAALFKSQLPLQVGGGNGIVAGDDMCLAVWNGGECVFFAEFQFLQHFETAPREAVDNQV